MDLGFGRLDTPVGPLVAYIRGDALVALEFEDRGNDVELRLGRRFGELRLVSGNGFSSIVSRLEAYFVGDIGALDTIRVDAAGTPFQQEVWAALRKIPAGTTTTYAEIARRIGHPRAFRAVGSANGGNPVAIVVPCHRVVGTDGRLHGYAGGIERKEWLLNHELKHCGRSNAIPTTKIVTLEHR